MKNIGFTLLLLLSIVNAQTEKLIPYRKGELWGFCTPDKKMVIPCKYDETTPFENGVAMVKINEKWGLIDIKGKEILAPKYKLIQKFQKNGLAVVANDDYLEGLINLSGKEIIPCKYSQILRFSDGLAGFLDKTVNLYGFIDETGKVIIKPTYRNIYPIFENGRTWVQNEKNQYFFIDKQGNPLFNQDFDYVFNFEGNLAPVKLNKKYGLIDINGKLVVPYQYDELLTYGHGLFSFSKNEKCYVLDDSGKEILKDLPYDFLSFLSKNLFCVSYDNNKLDEIDAKYGVINRQNKVVLSLDYDYIGNYSEGLIAACKNKKWGFVDSTGKVIIPFEYKDRIMEVSESLEALEFCEGFAIVPVKDNYWIYIDKTGKPLNGKNYLFASKFNNGLAYVCSDNYGKCGYIDKNGVEYWED